MDSVLGFFRVMSYMILQYLEGLMDGVISFRVIAGCEGCRRGEEDGWKRGQKI